MLYEGKYYKAKVTEILPRESVVWITYRDKSREDIDFEDVEARITRRLPGGKKIAKRKKGAAAQASERVAKKPKRAAGSELIGRRVLTDFGADGFFAGRIIRYVATHTEGGVDDLDVHKPFKVVYADGETAWESIDDADVELLPETVGNHVCNECSCACASAAALRVHRHLCIGPPSVAVPRARAAKPAAKRVSRSAAKPAAKRVSRSAAKPAAKRVSRSAAKAAQSFLVDAPCDDDSSSAAEDSESESYASDEDSESERESESESESESEKVSDDLFSEIESEVSEEDSERESEASDVVAGSAHAAAHKRSWPNAARDTERVIASLGFSLASTVQVR